MVMDDYISWEDTQVIKDNMNDLEESDQFLRSIYQSTRILKKDVEAYVDTFENESDLDNFVSGELSASIIKSINNMPLTK